MAILKDIETSDLTELNIWARSLDLPVGKNEKSVRRTLSGYYNLELSETDTKPENGKVITINRAELSSYYTIEEIDESVAEFEGRVNIIIDDLDKDIQHSIIADKINFNRTLNSITALGNVEYTKTENKNPMQVTGESITLKIGETKGSILKCISKQEKTIDEEDMIFYYVTAEIKMSDTEVMGMNDVTVQTVSGSPYFNISASDLWMLDSSDFVMILPSIKIGHVPVFGFPFYYHSDNSLYFNPVYGVESRAGTILQNTLYLMGSKTVNKEDSDFSFLSFDNGEGANNQELNGLTLVPSQDNTKYSEDYSKIIFDYYSNLGMYIGNETEVNFSKINTKINLETGIGFSRNIDNSDGTIYFENSESEWNSSYLLNSEVPFRYMLYFTLTSPIANINFTTLSDPYFRSDFLNREENFKWIDYFTDQLDDGLDSLATDSTDSSYSRNTTEESVVSDYSCGIDFKKISPNVKLLNPFVNSFVFDVKNMEIEFQSKISQETTTNESDQVITTNSYEDYDPAYKFYYPEEIKIPISLTLAGSFFDTKFVKTEAKQEEKEFDIYKSENPLFDINNPTSLDLVEKDEKSNIESEENIIYKITDDHIFKNENVLVQESNNENSTDFTYSIKAPLNLYGYWDNDEWYNRNDVDYDLLEKDILYNFDPSFTGVFSLDLLDSFFTIKNTTSGNIYIKSYLEKDDQDDLLSMYKWNKTLLNDDLSLQLNLFEIFPNIEKHSIVLEYDLKALLYENKFDNDEYELQGSLLPYYKITEFEWTEDCIEKNEITGTYKYDLDFSETSLIYTKTLPPFDYESTLDEDTVTLKQDFDFDIFNNLNNKSNTIVKYNTVTTEEAIDTEIISLSEVYSLDISDIKISIGSSVDYSESFIDMETEEDEWDFEEINFKAEYKYSDFLEIGFSTDYSIEDEAWELYSGELSLWDFDFSLSSRYSKPIVWDSELINWKTQSDEDETLQADSLTIKHSFDLKKFYLWKNRIILDIDSELTFKKEFIEVDKSYLNYNLIFSLDIFEFLSLKFNSSSSNKSIYRYWQSDMDLLGLTAETKNIFEDLIKSFNFFSGNDDDRIESGFNINSISVDAIYKMPDWNLIFSYSSTPTLKENVYELYDVFSLFVEWKPLSLVRSKVVNDDENWSVSTSSNSE